MISDNPVRHVHIIGIILSNFDLYIVTKYTSTFYILLLQCNSETSKVDEQQIVCPNAVIIVTTF